MVPRSELLDILGDRSVRAVAMLCDSVRLDFAQFLALHVEGRLQSRPHFFARLGRDTLIELREGLQREINRLIADSERPVHELRAALLAERRDRDRETAALAGALGALVEEAARKLLVAFHFPGDDTPDHADKPIRDLHPEFHIGYAPSPLLLWAWRQVRALDIATEQLNAAEEGHPVPGTFEIRCFLPEALPH